MGCHSQSLRIFRDALSLSALSFDVSSASSSHLSPPPPIDRQLGNKKVDLTYINLPAYEPIHEGPCSDLQAICLASMSISFCQLCRHRTDNFVVVDGRGAGVRGRRSRGAAGRQTGRRTGSADPLLSAWRPSFDTRPVRSIRPSNPSPDPPDVGNV